MSDEALAQLSDERRVLARQMINLIATDETFRNLILDDPIAAMEHGGLVDNHDELVDKFFEVKVDPDAEVEGFASYSLGISQIRPKDASVSTVGIHAGGLRAQPSWIAAPSCSFPTTGQNC